MNYIRPIVGSFLNEANLSYDDRSGESVIDQICRAQTDDHSQNITDDLLQLVCQNLFKSGVVGDEHSGFMSGQENELEIFK